jgi:cell wall-associated NlpC family hydrolase
MLGLPYVWGGDDPIRGFDCSGFVIEVLQSVGVLPFPGDWTAQGLWEHFKAARTETPSAGCLVLWRPAGVDRATHVELCLNDELSIGASGGGSATRTAADAATQNAYVRIRPFRGRGIIKGYVDPFETQIR